MDKHQSSAVNHFFNFVSRSGFALQPRACFVQFVIHHPDVCLSLASVSNPHYVHPFRAENGIFTCGQ
jgi:hypothetical protein